MKKYVVDHWHNFQHHFHHHPHPQVAEGTIEMTPAQEKAFRREGLRVILGAFLIHFVLGCFYLWGGISLYVASFLRERDENIDIDLVKMVFPFMNVAINAVTSFGVKLADRIGHQLVCFIGIIIIAGAVFIVSFVKTFIPFLLIYALLIGFSSGLMYMVPVVCGWKYFPKKKGLISGFIIAGYGFGSFTFNLIALELVNPDNEKASIPHDGHKYFTSDVYDRVPYMFRILALIYLVIGLVGAALIKLPKTLPAEHHDEQQHNLVKGTVTKGHEHHEEHHEHHDCENVSDAFVTRPFWLLILLVVFGSFFGLMMANNYKVYGLEKLGDDSFVTLVGSIGSACNGCSRLIWAALFDKYGFKRVYFVLMSIQIAIAASLNYISEEKILYLIWYALTMATEGGQFSMMPAVTAKVFGTKKGPLIYGFIFFSFAVANMGSFFLTKFGLKPLGWTPIFWICFGFSIAAFVLNLLFNENYDDFRVAKNGGHRLANVHETHEIQMAHDDHAHDDHSPEEHDSSSKKV